MVELLRYYRIYEIRVRKTQIDCTASISGICQIWRDGSAIVVRRSIGFVFSLGASELERS